MLKRLVKLTHKEFSRGRLLGPTGVVDEAGLPLIVTVELKVTVETFRHSMSFLGLLKEACLEDLHR
jgi:hypothetical protein